MSDSPQPLPIFTLFLGGSRKKDRETEFWSKTRFLAPVSTPTRLLQVADSHRQDFQFPQPVYQTFHPCNPLVEFSSLHRGL